jgi:broad specificity phosphatase PhoE
MGMSGKLVTVLLLVLAGTCLAAQEAVFVIRHAEQDVFSSDPGLRPEGRDRARAWARVLAPTGLDVVVTSDLRRSRSTGALVAEALGIPRVEFGKSDYEAIRDFLRESYPEGRVLIIGHSGTISSLLRSFGHTEYVRVSKSDYGGLFIVAPAETGAPMVTRLSIE